MSTAVRLLDNVIDTRISRFRSSKPRSAKPEGSVSASPGLADALIMLGLRYGDEASLAFAAETMRAICHAAYRQSVTIAQEKGPFPDFEREHYLEGPFIRGLPADIRNAIARNGIRNSHLLAIAPTGTISLLAGNVSSGIEPVFAPEYQRAVLNGRGKPAHFLLSNYALRNGASSPVGVMACQTHS